MYYIDYFYSIRFLFIGRILFRFQLCLFYYSKKENNVALNNRSHCQKEIIEKMRYNLSANYLSFLHQNKSNIKKKQKEYSFIFREVSSDIF